MPTPQKSPVDHEVVHARLVVTLDDLQKQRDAIIREFPTYQEDSAVTLAKMTEILTKYPPPLPPIVPPMPSSVKLTGAASNAPEESSNESISLLTPDDITSALNLARSTIKRHISLLHAYNEIRDVGQGLFGMIAEQKGVRIVEVMEEFGMGVDD